MKTKIVMILMFFSAVLIVFSGCVPESKLDECQRSISEEETVKENTEKSIDELKVQIGNSTIERDVLNDILDIKNDEIEDKIGELNKLNSEYAEIEINIVPNPIVIPKDNVIKWKVIIKEINGIGVKIKSCTRIYFFTYKQNRIIDNPELENSYLPAFEEYEWEIGHNDSGSTKCIRYLVEAEDDNGNFITAVSDKIFVER